MRRIRAVRESPRKANLRSPKKIKAPMSSESEDKNDDDDDDKPLTRSPRSRTLRARKTWNYAKMLASNSEESEDSDDNSTKREEGRPRRSKKRSTDSSVSEDVVRSRRLRQNLQVRHYVENSDSCEEDDDEGVNISVSVSSRGRIRRLTAKARASVFRD